MILYTGTNRGSERRQILRRLQRSQSGLAGALASADYRWVMEEIEAKGVLDGLVPKQAA